MRFLRKRLQDRWGTLVFGQVLVLLEHKEKFSEKILIE